MYHAFMFGAQRQRFVALRKGLLAAGAILGAVCGLCLWRSRRPDAGRA